MTEVKKRKDGFKFDTHEFRSFRTFKKKGICRYPKEELGQSQGNQYGRHPHAVSETSQRERVVNFF